MGYYTPDRNEYGGEDYSGSLDGIVILISIFFFYFALAWICKHICKSELAVIRFFQIVTHGPNIGFLMLVLYRDPFRSFSHFMGSLGFMIFSTFLFWGVREVFTTTTWQEIKTKIERKEISRNQKDEGA